MSAAEKPKAKENPLKAALLSLLTSSLLLSAAMVAVSVAEMPANSGTPSPLGHKEFYPSPERPVGFRGDGVGADNADDWPQWRGGPARTGAGLGASLSIAGKTISFDAASGRSVCK